MSNIRATCDEFNIGSSGQTHTRNYLRRVSFNDFDIFTLKDGTDLDEFYPVGYESAIFFLTLEQMGLQRPSIITKGAWKTLKKTASCFITGNKTLMPRAIFPDAKYWINNGLIHDSDESIPGSTISGPAYNWKYYTYNAPTATAGAIDEVQKYAILKEDDNKKIKYIEVKQGTEAKSKEQLEASQRMFKLDAPLQEDQKAGYMNGGAGGAACAFTFSFSAVSTAKLSPADAESFVPRIVIEMGSELTIGIDKHGLMLVNVDGQLLHGSLVKTTASNAPIQNSDGPENFVVFIYPVWNGVVVASGVTDSKNLVEATNLYCIKNNNVNINDYTNPSITDYKQDTDSPIEIEYTDDSIIADWGDTIKMYWVGMRGNFSYTPAWFVPYAKCSVYFKDRVAVSGDPATYSFEAYPIFSKQGVVQNGEFSVVDNDAELIAGSEDGNGYAYYRYDFEFTNDNEWWTRRGVEAWGYIQKSVENTVLAIPNYNGPLNLDTLPITSDGAAPNLDDWSNYIKSINVTVGFDSMSGSLTLDKYAMAGQNVTPPQLAGGIKITINGGEPGVLHGGNPIFSGIYLGVSDSDSSSDDTWTIPLVGMEQKLEDIKLVNIPFWDGDDVKIVTDYLASYGGVEISYTDGGAPFTDLPRSTDFATPAINFPTGTTVIEAIRQCAEWSNHIFMFQPDGIGQMYELNYQGVAKQVYDSTIYNYENTIAQSKDTTPVFDNMYNNITTVGLIVNELGSRDILSETQVAPKIKNTRHATTDPNFSWLKMFVSGENGVLTADELDRLHSINEKKSQKYIQTGSVTVPGDSRPNLLDRVQISGENMGYIHSISHNVDFSSKTWTTSFSLGKQ